ncbi:bifunctional transcriptional activator/DNA repair enzyme AdaA [Sphingoaurantiacus capsulatus]|uniref:Bifunctional transcriptional activator/DNA repair enzyme AdaA n=1 Tax=Sphingoaurantiacus capsulatus TaxID=1771310 RepID=A0ABV7XD96_9SPHN
MLDDTAYYDAIRRRDPAADGLFFIGVHTTGIYCRPICPARTPLRRNISFFASAAAAQEAGLRPCLRCRPESAPESPAWLGSMATINRALRLIDEGALVEGDIDALADRLGVTARHLRRLFDRHLGVSPIAIEQTRRVHLAKKLIHETQLPLTEIAFAAGYGSIRRFNESFATRFGQPPSALRRRQARPVEGLSVTLAYRPPLDWAGLCGRVIEAGGSADAESLRFDLPTGAPIVARRASRANSLSLDLGAVDTRDLGRAIAYAKRLLIGRLPLH